MQIIVKFLEKIVDDIEISLIVSWKRPQNELFSLKKLAFKIFILKIVKNAFNHPKIKNWPNDMLSDAWTPSWITIKVFP